MLRRAGGGCARPVCCKSRTEIGQDLLLRMGQFERERVLPYFNGARTADIGPVQVTLHNFSVVTLTNRSG
jgi:hypothetical protein